MILRAWMVWSLASVAVTPAGRILTASFENESLGAVIAFALPMGLPERSDCLLPLALCLSRSR